MRKKITTLEELAVIIKDGFDMLNGRSDKNDKKLKKNKRTKIKKKMI
jgi:hypothetical protein